MESEESHTRGMGGEMWNLQRMFREQRNLWLSILGLVVYYTLARYTSILAKVEELRDENKRLKNRLEGGVSSEQAKKSTEKAHPKKVD